VSVTALVDAGGTSDGRGGEGVAHLTAKLLPEGAGGLDGAALTERLELLGAAVTSGADWDFADISLTVASERFSEAMRTLGEIVAAPALPMDEFERLRGERLAELLQTRTEPRTLADEAFSTILYHAESRYSKPLGGSVRSVRAAGIDDVRVFHRLRYVPSATTVIVAGDVAPRTALAHVEQALGSWRGGTAPRGHTSARQARTEARLHVVPKPEAPQSELRIGHVGVPRSSPDYFSLVVMNAILGGLFSSRINLNLREKRGYTYGAFSSLDWRREAGPLTIATAVKSDVTAESIREVLVEIDRIRAEPVDASELSLAVDYLEGVFPIRFETTAAVAGALSALVAFELGDDYYDRYRSRITAVSAADVLEAARRHIRPSELKIVVVGDPAVVRPPLEAMAEGKVDVHEVEQILE
jgi:zinc protease